MKNSRQELVLQEERRKNRELIERFCNYYHKIGLEQEMPNRPIGTKLHNCIAKNFPETDLPFEDILQGIHPINVGLYNGIVNSDIEKKIVSLYEGLISSYPIDKLHSAIVKIFAKHIPEKMINMDLRDYSEIFPLGHTSGKVVDQILVPGNKLEDSEVCQFVVPIDDSVEVNDLIDDCIDNLHLYGWDYSTHLVRTSENSSKKVLLVTFEKRFSNPIEILGETLFHVCPLRVVNSIFEQGITPRSQSRRYRYPERVYLFDIRNEENIEDILNYVESRRNLHGMEKYCMLMVDFDKIKKSPRFVSGNWKFYVDPMFRQRNNPAIFTYEPISRNFLNREKIITI